MPTPNDRGPHRPRTNIQYHVENGWVVPDQPQTPPRRTSTQEQRRAAARRARAKRRRLRQLALIGTACGILVVSGTTQPFSTWYCIFVRGRWGPRSFGVGMAQPPFVRICKNGKS